MHVSAPSDRGVLLRIPTAAPTRVDATRWCGARRLPRRRRRRRRRLRLLLHPLLLRRCRRHCRPDRGSSTSFRSRQTMCRPRRHRTPRRRLSRATCPRSLPTIWPRAPQARRPSRASPNAKACALECPLTSGRVRCRPPQRRARQRVRAAATTLQQERPACSGSTRAELALSSPSLIHHLRRHRRHHHRHRHCRRHAASWRSTRASASRQRTSTFRWSRLVWRALGTKPPALDTMTCV